MAIKMKSKCYMCDEEEINREHVPPKSFFPKGYRDPLWTVASCEAHNNDNSVDVEYVRNVMVCHINCTGDAHQIAQNTTLRSFGYNEKLFLETFNNLRPIIVNGEETGTFPIDLDKFEKIMEAIANAIHYRDFGITHTQGWTVFSPNMLSSKIVYEGLPDNWKPFREALEHLQFETQKTPHPEVFKYGIHRFDEDRLAYKFEFYEGFIVNAITKFKDVKDYK